MMLNPFQALVLHKKPSLHGLKTAIAVFTNVMMSAHSGQVDMETFHPMSDFVQNKCLEWIQHHENPLVRNITCYIEQDEIYKIFA